MRRTCPLLMAAFALIAASEPPVPIVASASPDSVSVTIYRDSGRDVENGIDAEEGLNGYALITETRTVDLPPGAVTIRFEGVASGIQPETALVQGIDAAEKNQDRQLLSRGGLLDAFTGQQVIIRRTDRATGKVTEERARIRSGSGRVVIETSAGFESLDCTGLNQAPIYPGIPSGLSAKPVLSVTTGPQPGGRRVVTLSYLAGNFDWQANYVAKLSGDATSIDLFAWVTLASADDVSFIDAQTNAVAGKVARVDRDEDEDYDEDDEQDNRWFHCWPSGTTSDSPSLGDNLSELPAVTAPSMRMRLEQYASVAEDGENIVVTGSRIATQEDLGDLKLYRIPFPVTVASNGQKQVAFLSKPGVKGVLLYRSKINRGEDPVLLFRTRNRKQDGLGEPLPAGQVAMFQDVAGQRLLMGETTIEDKAVDEDVEFELGDAVNVSVDSEYLDHGDNWEKNRLTVSNANPYPIRYEAEFRNDAGTRFERFSRSTSRRYGKTIWSVTVPANGEARLDYREVEIDNDDDE